MKNIIVKGVSSVKAYLAVKKKELESDQEKGIKNATLFLEGDIKTSIARGTNAPVTVDTGRFLNSVTSTSSKNEGKVYTKLGYSKYLEYGTSRMKARPHFRNTVAKDSKKIKSIIDNAISL